MKDLFTTEQETLFNKLRVMRDAVTEQPLQGSPCPLLRMQLVDLQAFARKMLRHAGELHVTLDEDGIAR